MPSAPTFADVLPFKKLSSHTYSVHLEDAWCIGTVPNGGYITSAFIIAAHTHMTTTHSARKQPDVINLHLEFVRRTAVGEAIFTVNDVKIGARLSNLHLTLSQHNNPSDPSSPMQTEVQGYITMTSIPDEKGPTLPTQYKLRPEPFPVSLPTLSSDGQDKNYILRRPDAFGHFRRGTHNMQMHLIRHEVRKSAPPSDFSPAMTDQWVRFYPPTDLHPATDTKTHYPITNRTLGRWTNDSLGYVVDIFPQTVEKYLNSEVEDALITDRTRLPDTQLKQITNKSKLGSQAKFWYPTLLLNLDMKKKLPEEGVEWLFVRVQAKKILNGRFDLNVEVWDEEGDLVALSTHAALAVDASRNITRGNDKGKKTESKI